MILSFILPHFDLNHFFTHVNYGFQSLIYFDTHFDCHFQILSHQNQEQMNFLKFIVLICLKKNQNSFCFLILVTFYLTKQKVNQYEKMVNDPLISS